MSDTSPILNLPYIQPAQAQKHVTHNESLRLLDVLTQLTVQGQATMPPASPAVGARYLVGAGATGDWAGQDTAIAFYETTGWAFISPYAGMVAYETGADRPLVFDGTGWVPMRPDLTGAVLNNLGGVGVGASSDPVNLLSVASEATLLSHAGAGHQVKVNKNAPTDTASLLFQTGWTGHAEMGLAGNNDFSIKVSPDGGAWTTALTVDAATGAVSLPATGAREVLTGPRTWYVDPAGSDSNDGLTPGSAFQSLQWAVIAALTVDAKGNPVTIQLVDGTHSLPGACFVPMSPLGVSQLTIQGNPAAPGNVVLDSAGGVLETLGVVVLDGVTITGAGGGITAHAGAQITCQNVHFGTVGGAHLLLAGGRGQVLSGCDITGGATHFVQLVRNAWLGMGSVTLSLSGTPHFSGAFLEANGCSTAEVAGNTYNGTATGKRYEARLNAVIETGGAGATYFPGDVAGVVSNGGIYV